MNFDNFAKIFIEKFPIFQNTTSKLSLHSSGGQTALASSIQASFSIQWLSSIATIIAILLQIFLIYRYWKEIEGQQKLFIENQSLKEREDIRYKLNHFFGPMRQLRAESKILYDAFACQEKDENINFRTLTYLIEKYPFSEQDRSILEQIIELGKKQLDLIEKEGWAVTNSALTDLLGSLGSHIRILILAHDSKLQQINEAIKSLVFPLEIDGALETEVRKLQDRYRYLLGNLSDKKLPNRSFPFSAQILRFFRQSQYNEEQARTISYYNKKYREYFEKTKSCDLSEIYNKFTKEICRGALILDAGCGVGRDTRYFIKRGYRVISFDASREMVNLCRQYPFAYCTRDSFETISFVEEFDAIWACNSLVHCDKKHFQQAVIKLRKSVKPRGIIYISLKTLKEQDITEKETNLIRKTDSSGRTFYYYPQSLVQQILEEELGLGKIEIWKNLSQVDSSCEIINYLYKKPNS